MQVHWIHLGHHCSCPGCTKVLVVDGNMKNHRDVCMARDAGFITFEGHPGHIKSGCILTPELKSRYCSLHTPRICVREDDASTSEDIAEMILEKKVTRSSVFYKVRLLLECENPHAQIPGG